ncbi:DUF402 domain-containing protein [Bacillus sp. CGMCC 1.16607]|uniref:DUF402 domain-containing protein n=1 Tax=Bacillus sp. CGMCC 1.16607 TaxID=3351842 RepID=UPI00363C89E1
MLKRQFGDRSEWKRVIKREYAQVFLDSKEFTGHITLLKIDKVSQPLFVQYGEKKICIVDDGYIWLQHFPTNQHFSVTTMFDTEGEIVQWYIDICNEIGLANNVPYLDDLFLDIVFLPNGEVIVMDEDELEEALSEGIINRSLFDLAWEEANQIRESISQGQFTLINVTKNHKDMLLQKL